VRSLPTAESEGSHRPRRTPTGTHRPTSAPCGPPTWRVGSTPSSPPRADERLALAQCDRCRSNLAAIAGAPATTGPVEGLAPRRRVVEVRPALRGLRVLLVLAVPGLLLLAVETRSPSLPPPFMRRTARGTVTPCPRQ
jgi:hypothetical protein